MRIDFSDLDRMAGIAEAFGRLFWCLMAVAFLAALFGSAGTGLLVLILGAASFCARVGFEDFVRARRGEEDRSAKPQARSEPEPEFTVHRTSRRPRRTRVRALSRDDV
ncbi:MAG TPA: hypothetical protein VN522_01580 [Solirubrobacterales bacterium]|nr:hypothetical protein [Solirubrobacterales bacterium]